MMKEKIAAEWIRRYQAAVGGVESITCDNKNNFTITLDRATRAPGTSGANTYPWHNFREMVIAHEKRAEAAARLASTAAALLAGQYHAAQDALGPRLGTVVDISIKDAGTGPQFTAELTDHYREQTGKSDRSITYTGILLVLVTIDMERKARRLAEAAELETAEPGKLVARYNELQKELVPFVNWSSLMFLDPLNDQVFCIPGKGRSDPLTYNRATVLKLIAALAGKVDGEPFHGFRCNPNPYGGVGR